MILCRKQRWLYYEENKDATRQYYVRKKNDKRQNYEENKDTKKQYFKKYIISKKKNQKKITTKSTTGFRELKKFVTINVKMSWHKKENCSMISTKKNYL